MSPATERDLGRALACMSAIYLLGSYVSAFNDTMPAAETRGASGMTWSPLTELGIFLWVIMTIIAPVCAVVFVAWTWMTNPVREYYGGGFHGDDVPPPYPIA